MLQGDELTTETGYLLPDRLYTFLPTKSCLCLRFSTDAEHLIFDFGILILNKHFI